MTFRHNKHRTRIYLHKQRDILIDNYVPTKFVFILGGVAAYNFGVGNVRSWDHLDVGTTHNDYSNDVIARAQWLIKKYKW